MTCNCYQLADVQILIYGDKPEVPEFLNATLVAENVDPSKYPTVPIYRTDLIFSSCLGKRNRETILEEEHVISYSDLASAYFLIKTKSLRKPKKVRDLITDKYIEILDLVNHEQ